MPLPFSFRLLVKKIGKLEFYLPNLSLILSMVTIPVYASHIGKAARQGNLFLTTHIIPEYRKERIEMKSK